MERSSRSRGFLAGRRALLALATASLCGIPPVDAAPGRRADGIGLEGPFAGVGDAALGSLVDAEGEPGTFRSPLVHATLRASLGEEVADGLPIRIEIVPDAGYHAYLPGARESQELGAGLPTVVTVLPESAKLVRARVVEAEPPADGPLVASGAVEGPVVLELVFEPGEPAAFVVGLHTCSDANCDPPVGIRVEADPGDGGQAADIAFEELAYADADADPLPLVVDAKPAPALATAGADADAEAAAAAPLALPVVLLSGLLGGLILNLMPCVLPVLGLKLMSFAQQSGRARREVFEMNLWYCAGVYAVFFALATASVAANIGLAGTNLGWGQQFQFVSFRIAMLGIVFAFALSFLGVWEIPIPGFIGEQAGHVQTKEGPVGSFLKGALGTVLATPCSGPFLGPVFGFTLGASTPVTYAVFGAIATGMTLPYVLVGLFPGLVRVLPKPGPWMATFKELLGFVMLGTVAYLFSMLRQQPAWFLPAFVMLIGIWMGCWWVGRLQERQGSVGIGRWMQAASIAALVGAGGFLWLGPRVGADGPLIAWEQPFSTERLASLREGGSTVLVECTADWCLTCQTNLATAIETREVAEVIRRNRVVPILADFTSRSPEINHFLSGMGSRSIPFLAIFPAVTPGEPPRPPILLRDVITKAQLVDALEQAGPSRVPMPELRAASAAAGSAGR